MFLVNIRHCWPFCDERSGVDIFEALPVEIFVRSEKFSKARPIQRKTTMNSPPRPHPVVDIVKQSGIDSQVPTDIAKEGLGTKAMRNSNFRRLSLSLPKRTLCRVSHVPAPKANDCAHKFINGQIAKLLNNHMERSFHSNMHFNTPKYVTRMRSPVESAPPCQQESLYQERRSPRRRIRDEVRESSVPDFDIVEPRMSRTFSGNEMRSMLGNDMRRSFEETL